MKKRNLAAKTYVPGIEKYPDLESQFDRQRVNLRRNCQDCDWNNLVAQFAYKVIRRQRAEAFARRRPRPA